MMNRTHVTFTFVDETNQPSTVSLHVVFRLKATSNHTFSSLVKLYKVQPLLQTNPFHVIDLKTCANSCFNLPLVGSATTIKFGLTCKIGDM